MNREVIFSVVYCFVTVGAFCIGKYIFPRIPAEVKDKLSYLAGWAADFVVWAREFKKMDSGEEKMAAVVEQLKAVAAEAGIEATEDQLKAIAQTAYEAMKAGKEEAKLGIAVEEIKTAPAVVINAGKGTVAVTTDKVPDSALQESPDGKEKEPIKVEG